MNQSTITNDYASPSQGSKREDTVPLTAQPSHHFSQTKTTKHQDLLIPVSISVTSTLALLIIFAVVFYIRKARQTGNYLWCNSFDAETAGISDSGNDHKPTKGNLGRISLF